MNGLGSDCMLNIIMISALIQVKSVSFKLISCLLEQSFTHTAHFMVSEHKVAAIKVS